MNVAGAHHSLEIISIFFFLSAVHKQTDILRDINFNTHIKKKKTGMYRYIQVCNQLCGFGASAWKYCAQFAGHEIDQGEEAASSGPSSLACGEEERRFSTVSMADIGCIALPSHKVPAREASSLL